MLTNLLGQAYYARIIKQAKEGMYIRVQNKVTCVQITKGSLTAEMVLPHIKRMWPKAKITTKGTNYIYIHFKLTKTQISILKDYLNFMFN